MEAKYRMKVNVNQSDKGILTFDCTVEVEQSDGKVFPVYEKVERLAKLLENKFRLTSLDDV